MNNNLPADLFNDYQAPTFETGTSVPAQTQSEFQKNFSDNSLSFGIVIASVITAILLFTVIKKLLQKPTSNVEYIKEEVVQRVEPAPKPHAVEIKNKKENSNFATPTNINKCIRGFLENTRTK